MLYDYQKEALERVSGKKRCAFYHDMGLGKTFTGFAKAVEIGNSCNLIVCQKSKVVDWLAHIETQGFEAVDLTKPKAVLESGYGVINYDLIFRRSFLKKLEGYTLVFDESSLLQNPSSKRTKAALKMAAKADSLILLSGTPTDGKYERLWTQLHMLGWDISEKLFERQYVKIEYDMLQGFPIKKIKGYKNELRLSRKMDFYGCDFLKTNDVMTLPEQRFITVPIPKTNEYSVFERDSIISAFDRDFIGDTVLGAMTCERLLAGAYSEKKLESLADILQSTNGRIVVFYNFNVELEKLKTITEKPFSIVNGDSHDISVFNANENAVCLVQYQAGAMGLNLQNAHYAVYFSPPLATSLYEQSKKRIHRIGQNEKCIYYNLVSVGTIEEKIYLTLAKRNDYTEKLFERSKLVCSKSN